MKRPVLSIILLLAAAGWAGAEYPCIQTLKPSDVLFSQLQEDIESYYKALGRGRGRPFPCLSFFTYARTGNETIFTLAARLNLPYETIASLNGFAQADEFVSASQILVPNMPGVFVPLRPANALEEIMAAWRGSHGEPGERIVVQTPAGERELVFYRGQKFHAVERAFFLKILFHFPLQNAVITSDFGPRTDPFNGHAAFHNGIDLAAPIGTFVSAAREGVVKATGYSDVYGNFVRVAHPAGYETLYGHLSVILVKAGEKVAGHAPLGRVGMSGRTTGPHLHFEVLRNGKPINPSSMLPR